MFQIEIPKRGAVCAHHGEALTPGSEYYSALKAGEQEGLLSRKDYCAACWETLQQNKQLLDVISSWKSMVPPKKEGSDLPKQRDERALYLLKEALASSEDRRDEAFVLALYLARRRRLYLRQELKRANQPPASIYEVAETEEMLCVPKVSLSQLQVETVQIELAKKFNAK